MNDYRHGMSYCMKHATVTVAKETILYMGYGS